jgi:prevent-host-death family protein
LYKQAFTELGYDVLMEEIPGTMAVSEARANLTEVVNAVRLQDRTVRLTRRGTQQAAIVPTDVLDLIEEAGGLERARAALRNYSDAPRLAD